MEKGNHKYSSSVNPAAVGVALGLRESAYKLQQHSQQALVKDGNHLGGSRAGSSERIRMALACGPMHPLACRLNQGQD